MSPWRFSRREYTRLSCWRWRRWACCVFADEGVAVRRQLQLEESADNPDLPLLAPRVHHLALPVGTLAELFINQRSKLGKVDGVETALSSLVIGSCIGTVVIDSKPSLETQQASLCTVLSRRRRLGARCDLLPPFLSVARRPSFFQFGCSS